MKKLVVLLGLLCLVSTSASAEVESLSIKFGGGCVSTNTGSCTIKATAAGSSLSESKIRLQHAATQSGPWKNVGLNSRSLSETGRAQFKFANKDGCYRAITDFNGNDADDIVSRKICEK